MTRQTCTKRDSNSCSQTPKTGFLGSWPICKHQWPRQACANMQSCQTLHCCQRRDVDEGSGQHLGIKPHHIAAHKHLKTLHLCGPRCEKTCLRCLQTAMAQTSLGISTVFLLLFDLILYVHSTIFQLCGTGLPGLNQY